MFLCLVSQDDYFLTMFFPFVGNSTRWEISTHLNAVQLLAINTYCTSMMNKGNSLQQAGFSRLIAEYSVILPGKIKYVLSYIV